MIFKKEKYKDKGCRSYHWIVANTKKKLMYIYTLQLTLKNPWLLPKYKDNYLGIEGYRLYGWLFIYFGKYCSGILYPGKIEDKGGFVYKGQRYFVASRDKNPNIPKFIKIMEKRKSSNVTITKEYINDEKYNVTIKIS